VTSTSPAAPRTGDPVAGSPCWVELATAEPEAAMGFYRTMLGWEYTRHADAAGADYYVARVAGEPVAGIRPARAPLFDWTLYLATGDLDGVVRRSAELGGRVLEAAHGLPGVGTTALVEAPVGAVFGACRLAPDWGFTAGVPRALVWAEYITHHAQRADTFFGELFGFTGKQFGDGITDDYMVWYAGEDSVIGRVRMMDGTPQGVPPRWVAHFRVPEELDFDDAVLLAHDAGARLRFRPYSTTLGRVAVLSDATGARFALIDPSLAVDDGAVRSAADDPFDD
jgi:uncharacterized protein